MSTARSPRPARGLRPRWMAPGWIYAYRCRKPGAVLGLPLIGWHWGYVGQTRNPRMRHLEHTEGGGRYGKPPASWSDRKPRRFVLFYLPMCPQWLLNVVEAMWVVLLWPVYNDKLNRWNPRRISRRGAARMRVLRDAGVWTPNLKAVPLLALTALALWVGVQVLWL